MIVGNSLDGSYRLFELSFEEIGACENDLFFYDDKQDIVTFVKNDGTSMEQFWVDQDEVCLRELNKIYDLLPVIFGVKKCLAGVSKRIRADDRRVQMRSIRLSWVCQVNCHCI